jgi:hypothetical protein
VLYVIITLYKFHYRKGNGNYHRAADCEALVLAKEYPGQTIILFRAAEVLLMPVELRRTKHK